MRVKHWFKRSSPVAWTTATLCFSASRKDLWIGCSPFRTPPTVCLSGYWYSTFRPHNAGARSVSYTAGYWYARASTSRLRRSLIGRCLAFHHHSDRIPSQWPPSFCRCSRATTICSTTCRTCVVSCDVDTFDDRGFAAAGPGLWNCLPPHAKEADLSYNRFRRSLKTFLFR